MSRSYIDLRLLISSTEIVKHRITPEDINNGVKHEYTNKLNI